MLVTGLRAVKEERMASKAGVLFLLLLSLSTFAESSQAKKSDRQETINTVARTASA